MSSDLVSQQVIEGDSRVSARKKKANILFFRFIEISAIVLWLYVIIKIFIFDFDVFLISRFSPSLYWLITYKFFVILGVLAFIWLLTRSKYILGWIAGVILYPLFFVLWRLPRYFWKTGGWLMIIAFLNILFSFFRYIKYNFIIFALSAISLAIILFSNNIYVLVSSVTTILLLLILIYIHRFWIIFKPATIYQVHLNMISKILDMGRTSYTLNDELRALKIEDMSEKQLQAWSGNLQLSVLLCRGCDFFSEKLAEYKNSNLNIIFYVFSFILLISITVIFFSAANYGLYKIDPTNYAIQTHSTFFNFFYYSFSNLVYSSIPDINASSAFAKLFVLGEYSFSILLLVLLVTLLFSVRNTKESEEMNVAIGKIKAKSTSIDKMIRDEYKLTVEEAIDKLTELKAGMIQIIYYLSGRKQ